LFLKQSGIDAEHVADLGMAEVDDAEIIEAGRDVMTRCQDDVVAGAVVSEDVSRIRVHRLPLP
jgi:hypothetical protein